MKHAYGGTYDFELILTRLNDLVALLEAGNQVQAEISVEAFRDDMRAFGTPSREPVIEGKVRHFDTEAGLSHEAVVELSGALDRMLTEVRGTRTKEAIVRGKRAREAWVGSRHG